MKSESFTETVELVRQGNDVSQEELSEAWGYAADGVNEMYRFAKSLMAGYKSQLETIKRKDAILQAKIDEISNMKRTIWILNQKLRAAEGKGGGDK